MTADLLTVELRDEPHVVLARRRARDIAGMLGFESRDCVCIAATVSGIARNAWRHAGGGRVEFRLVRDGENDVLGITVRDHGPGIQNLPEILGGRGRFTTGIGIGLFASRRLMHRFDVNTSSQGTTVTLGQVIPRCFIDPIPIVAARIAERLIKFQSSDSTIEIEDQERELLQVLTALDKSESDLAQLNAELEETYRGVVSLYAELDDRAQEIQKVVDLKSRFLSNVTHEFRTPLNSIIGLSRMLLERIDGELTVEQEKQARFINHAARDLSDLVNDLLDLAKTDACKIEITPGPVSVNELFATLRGMLRPLIDSNSEVTLRFDAPLPPVEMVSDERKLSQILRNLISNALKYTLAGEVRVSARIDGARIIFCVRDTGIGIPAEHQDKIFEEFYQVQNPLQQKTRGTGLGLALSRRLANLLGGGITFQSTVGCGSTFWVDLPVLISSKDTAVGRPAPPPAADVQHLVLFVDNRMDVFFSYERMLDHTPFRAILARNTREAFNILNRVSVSAIVASSAETIHAVASGLPASRVSIPAFIVIGDPPTDAGLLDFVDVFIPVAAPPGQLLASLKELPLMDRITALIIDHSSDARQELRGVLEDFQVDVIEAATIDDGLIMIDELKPVLIFSEILFPDDLGIGLIERLHEAVEDGALIIHSSQVFTDEERDSFKRYASSLIRKGPANDSVYRTALIHEIAKARRRKTCV